MSLRYITFSFVAMLTMMALMQFTFPFFTETNAPHWAFHLLFVYLFVKYLVGYLLVDSKLKSSPKQFVNTFMMISGLRMLLSVLVIVILVLKAGANAKFICVYFVLGYLVFLAVEVVFLFKKSKANKPVI